MKAENLVLNDSSERQQVEQICIIFPNIRISVLSQALIIESIDLCNLSGFVVAPQNGDSILKSYF